jgi:hypothetical protein
LKERDNPRFDFLANTILGFDPTIYSVMMIDVRNGSTLTEMTRPDHRQDFGTLSQRTNGMAGKWGALAFNAMDRLQPTPSKAKYLVMMRERYMVLMFPVSADDEIMVSVIADAKSEPVKIYAIVYSYLSREFNLPSTEKMPPLKA